MKVSEMIKLLESKNPDAIVVMSSDEEGNSFSTFSGDTDTGHWNAENRDYHSHEHSASDCCMDDETYHADMQQTLPECLVIWP